MAPAWPFATSRPRARSRTTSSSRQATSRPCRTPTSSSISATGSCPASSRRSPTAMARRSTCSTGRSSSPGRGWGGPARSPRLARPGALRARWCGRSAPGSGTRRRPTLWPRRLDALDTEMAPGPRAVRAPADRHEPRGVRLPGAALRARAGAARGPLAGGGALRPGDRGARAARRGRGRDDRLLRDARVPEARRDRGARGRRADGRAEPARRAHRGRDRSAEQTTSPSCATISPPCATPSDAT